MACVFPPELDDIQIGMFLDGEADDQIVAHLAQCQHCHEKARTLARLQNGLKGRLYRQSCPTPEELRDYHYGLLPQAQAVGVTQHLTQCPHCTREIALLDNFLADQTQPAPITGPLERIRLLVAKLMENRSARLSPVFAGVRGDEQNVLVYQVENAQIGLEIGDDETTPGQKVLRGLVSGINLDGLTVHLWLSNRLVATAAVDGLLGDFGVPDLAPGSYELILSGPELKVRIPTVPVGVG